MVRSPTAATQQRDRCYLAQPPNRSGARKRTYSVEQRTVILLVGLEGMRYEAVAEIVGCPVGTIRSRLSRGREALRDLMGIKEKVAKAA